MPAIERNGGLEKASLRKGSLENRRENRFGAENDKCDDNSNNNAELSRSSFISFYSDISGIELRESRKRTWSAVTYAEQSNFVVQSDQLVRQSITGASSRFSYCDRSMRRACRLRADETVPASRKSGRESATRSGHDIFPAIKRAVTI